MDNIGGAEMVTLTLARELNADLYTTNFDAEKIKKMGFEDVLGRVHSIGKIPKMAPFRQQIVFWKFRRLNLSGQYDFFHNLRRLGDVGRGQQPPQSLVRPQSIERTLGIPRFYPDEHVKPLESGALRPLGLV